MLLSPDLLHPIVVKHPFREDVSKIGLLSLQLVFLQVILFYHQVFEDLAKLEAQLNGIC